MPQAPTLSADQRRAAYERSLELRRNRAELKQSLAAGELTLDSAWRLWPEITAGMKVCDLLTALPGVGPAKAKALLEKAGIPEKNTVRACGPRQTEKLFAEL